MNSYWKSACPQRSTSPLFEIAPQAPWRGWCVPAGIINQYEKTRLLPDDERYQAPLDIPEALKELVEGLLEQVKDRENKSPAQRANSHQSHNQHSKNFSGPIDRFDDWLRGGTRPPSPREIVQAAS